MGNNITQKLKYKESVIKFSYKYRVTKAAIKFGECKRTIYRWQKRYDGSLNSLKDKSRKPHYHPNQHTEAEIKTIQTDNGLEFTNRLSWNAFLKNKKTMFKKY